MKRNTRIAALAAAVLTAAGFTHAADPYPNHAVKLVVPFAPGGTTDIVARIVAAKGSFGSRSPHKAIPPAIGITLDIAEESGIAMIPRPMVNEFCNITSPATLATIAI